jgi:glycosyltransferase involved in cell wall biosynthesis
MNILFVDQFTELGGAQQCLLDLMPAVQERGWQAQVAAPGDGPMVDALRAMKIPCHRIPAGADVFRFASAFPRTVVALRRLVRSLAIDLVYVNGPRLLPAAACAGRPVVFHAHSVPEQRRARTLAGLALRSAAVEVIAVSEFAAASWRGFVPESRIRVIYNGTPDYGVRPGRSGGPLRIGIVGRIAPEKGHLDFIRAAHIVARSRSDVRFIICGAPLFSGEFYAEAVRAESRGAPVEFMGWQANVGPVLHALDVLVVPSAPNDAAPRVILEAFSAGVPVVAYPSGGIPELFAGGSGVLTPESTAGALASSILSLIADPERMQVLSATGRQSWSLRFRLERYRDEILALLSQAGTTGTQPRRDRLKSQPRQEQSRIRTAAS